MAGEDQKIRINPAPSKSRHRYAQVVDAIADAIQSGRLQPGERLPAQRDFAASHNFAIGTVSRAYAEAERLGLVEGEVGRGTFVSLNPAARETETRETPGVIDLTINRPPPEGCEKEFGDALKSLAKAPELGRLLGHHPSTGLSQHKSAVAHWIKSTGLAVLPEQIILCNGVQHALAVLFGALAQPGDLVLTEQLHYPGIRLLAQIYNLRLQGLGMDEQGLLPEALEEACKRRAARFLFCTPTIHNPTGSVMSAKRRKEIAELVERHGLTLIEDDMYVFLLPERPLPISALIPRQGYYVTGTSKSIAEGIRAGYIIAPQDSVGQLAVAVQATTWTPSAIMGEIITRWILDGTMERIITWNRKETAARQVLAAKYLAGLDFVGHPAAYHVWLNLPEPWRSEQFVRRARKLGILVTPAEVFVIGRELAPHAVRISLGNIADRCLVARGLQLLVQTLTDPPMFEPMVV